MKLGEAIDLVEACLANNSMTRVWVTGYADDPPNSRGYIVLGYFVVGGVQVEMWWSERELLMLAERGKWEFLDDVVRRLCEAWCFARRQS